MQSTSPKNPGFLKNSKYYARLRDLQDEHPHLRSLSMYMENMEKRRLEGKAASLDSNSIIITQVASPSYGWGNSTTWESETADVYDLQALAKHQATLRGEGKSGALTGPTRLVIVEDLSPGAIEALGTGLNIDPDVFYYHLGLDSINQKALSPSNFPENQIPIKKHIPGHGPGGFTSVLIPCELRFSDLATSNMETFQLDGTYCPVQYNRVIETATEAHGSNSRQIFRGFHRLTMLYLTGASHNPAHTIIIFAYPTWKSQLRDHKQVAAPPIHDYFGYSFDPRQNISDYERKTDMSKEGVWSDGQWERIRMVIKQLLYQVSPQNQHSHAHSIYNKSLLWLYSMMNKNYNLAYQTDYGLLLEITKITGSQNLPTKVSQQLRYQLRDSISRSLEAYRSAKSHLEEKLKPGISTFQAEYDKAKYAGETYLKFEKELLREVRQAIEDCHKAVELDLMLAKLKTLDTSAGDTSADLKGKEDDIIRSLRRDLASRLLS